MKAEESVSCGKCTMKFRVAPLPFKDVERSRCPECQRPFWHYAPNLGPKRPYRAIVGMTAEQLQEWWA